MNSPIEQAMIDSDAIIDIAITTYKDGSLMWLINHNTDVLPDGPSVQHIHRIFNEMMRALVQNEQQELLETAYGKTDINQEEDS